MLTVLLNIIIVCKMNSDFGMLEFPTVQSWMDTGRVFSCTELEVASVRAAGTGCLSRDQAGDPSSP